MPGGGGVQKDLGLCTDKRTAIPSLRNTSIFLFLADGLFAPDRQTRPLWASDSGSFGRCQSAHHYEKSTIVPERRYRGSPVQDVVSVLYLFLLHCHALRQVPGLIDVQASRYGYVVSDELEWDHGQGGREVFIGLRDVGDEVGGVFDVVMTVGGQTHQVGAAALALDHVADGLSRRDRSGSGCR